VRSFTSLVHKFTCRPALDEMEAFAVTLLVGIALLFAGFLLATTARSPRPSAAPGPAAETAPARTRAGAGTVST
jgi:hypothetical protein